MMLKQELDELLERGVLSGSEYDEFFENMTVARNGQVIGVCPKSHAQHKYDLNGDIWDEPLRDFLMKEVKFPIGIEKFDDVFSTYGKMVYLDQEYWVWWTRENIPDEALEEGCRPIEDATDEEIWKMIAIASRYWEMLYKRLWMNRKVVQEK